MKSYQDMTILKSYTSCGDENIATTFISPMLKITRIYKRSVGYFSSSVFSTIFDGIATLARNGGRIQLIASPKLSEEDVVAIKLGYEKKEEIMEKSFSQTFEEEIEQLNDDNLQLLAILISKNILDIKLAISKTIGDYHDKFGIMEDFDGNKVAFFGSANSSLNGYKNNYEKIRTVRDWFDGEKESVKDEDIEFDLLWSGKNPFVETYNYKETAERKLFEVIERRNYSKQSKNNIVLRDYQEEAINAWKSNDYKGFYVMATGTGKTWTAIFSAKELLKKNPVTIVICAPYKHLVKQWEEDVRSIFQSSKIILVSSENPSWDNQINREIIRKGFEPDNQIIIISTITSFNLPKFNNTLEKLKDDKLLIVDEAHRFNNRSEELKHIYKYRLGLSATPFSGSSAEKGKELMRFFGGQVYNLPIETALEKGFLVKYNYHPIYVTATEEEERKFQHYTMQIASCFSKGGVCLNPDLLVKSLRNRLRIISMAEEKTERLRDIISFVKPKEHLVVYCGDGRLYDSDTNELVKHIKLIKKALSKEGIKASQFTASENMKERMELVDAFNSGGIDSLVAIRCLDEGINIPSIRSALILSSNNDYREFVQRRGRILRKYPNKTHADIYDVVVLPSSTVDTWAKIELRRFYEYGKLANNWDEIKFDFYELLNTYNLDIEDIDIYDYEDLEEDLDE